MFFTCELCHLALLSDAKYLFAAIFLSGKDAEGRRKPRKKEMNNDK